MQNLDGVYEFNNFIKQYQNSDTNDKRPYRFKLWNTSGMQLIIRKDKKKIEIPEPFSINDLYNPAMIFCNVGLTDDQIPENIKANHEEWMKHTPAYFDDSGKIISLELKVTKEGIAVHNKIESLLKDAYTKINNKPIKIVNHFLDHPNYIMIEQ
jgi:hypothetical protein